LNKRDVCAQWACNLGLAGILESLPKRGCLMVLNYHRIGDSGSENFDDEVYSATAEGFEQQIAYLRRKFSVVTLDEAVALATAARPFCGTAILLTFDDGYIDNFRIAFPILRALNVQATFFLVSSYMHNPIIPWWDQIAYMVRNCPHQTLRLSYPETIEFPLPPGRRAQLISRILMLYKSPQTADTQRFIDELDRACSPYPSLPQGTRLFLNLDEAREMVRGGMAVGSHTVNHRVLAKLPREEQAGELSQSRSALTSALGVPIETLAYPVGLPTSFNEATRGALEESRYRAAFSFYGGLNWPNTTDRFDIKRIAVDDRPFTRFRLRVASVAAANGYWF
jgi:peptidoglycan/xylan/chitin deacetylase (PgdA/CDA1 family)